MPAVILFTACETVITSQEHTLSLINLLDLIRLEGKEPLPENLGLPKPWSVVSILGKERDDDDVVGFEQKIAVIQSNRTVVLQATSEVFSFSKPKHRQIFHLPAIPVGIPGEVKIQLDIRRSGTPDWRTIAECSFLVEHNLAVLEALAP